MATEQPEHLERLLKIYQRNLSYLEQQAAAYGGENNVPLGIRNQLLDTRDKIAELQRQIDPNAAAPPPAAAPPLPGTSPAAQVPATNEITLDFQLQENGARVTWRAPNVIGREVTMFTPPYDAIELPIVIRALDVLQYPNYPNPTTETEKRHFSFTDQEQQVLDAFGLWRDGRVVPTAHQVVGRDIYNGLGPAGQGVLKAVRNAGLAQRVTTNYVLRFPQEAINLAALPWEVLWDTDKNQAILIRGNTIDSCERYLDLDMPIPPPLPSGERLHLLALSPSYGIPDEIRRDEQAARKKTWDKLQDAEKITYSEISPLTIAALNDYLMDALTRPDVIHYFGHGVYRDGKGYLLFDDGNGGKDLVSAERLAAVLGDIKLVVIHACQSAMVAEEGGLLTGVAPALSVVTGAVVAMQLTVRIAAATRFAEVFYDQLLGRGRSLQEAVARGRQILFTEAADGASWYVPTLYIRSRDQKPIYLVQ